jgi:3',5'-cyclic AMP phosphodiesterase CpdA
VGLADDRNGATAGERPASVLATSDLHVHPRYPENRAILEDMRPSGNHDWLIVAGDVAEFVEDFEWALRVLAERFHTVIWAPGNHELWTVPRDPVQLRGEDRYRYLVDLCRRIGVLTPEDPYPLWEGPGGPVFVAPLFVGYDYTFRPEGADGKEEALARAYTAGVVCTDEVYLHPDPYPTRDAWCRQRVRVTEQRLAACAGTPTVLVNHYPLVREPTDVLRYPEFAQWCGTEATADWHVRFAATAVVYGHLHIPRTTWHDGVRFEEVSVGYPREWREHGLRRGPLRKVLPAPTGSGGVAP